MRQAPAGVALAVPALLVEHLAGRYVEDLAVERHRLALEADVPGDRDLRSQRTPSQAVELAAGRRRSAFDEGEIPGEEQVLADDRAELLRERVRAGSRGELRQRDAQRLAVPAVRLQPEIHIGRE